MIVFGLKRHRQLTPVAMAGPAPTDWLIAAVVGVAALAVLGKDIARGGLVDADSAAHVMDGVLIHDWVMAGPKAWTTPMLFAERQYGHYPTLGIGKHYPPGFAVVEAVFFVVFGVSGVSARLCVAFFGVLAAVGVYAFVRTIADRLAAMLAALLMIAIPATTHWGRQTMLEIPTLAVLTWSAVAFSWYLRQRTWRRFAMMAGAALLTILFKQTAVFLICAIAMALTWSSVRGRGPWSHAVCAVVVGFLSLGVMLLALDDACLKTVSGYNTFADRWSRQSLTFYLQTLPEQTGMIVLPAAALGALLTARRMSDHWWLLAAWLFTSYVMVTVASLKTPRFFFVGLFPLAVWAAFGAARCVQLLPSARLRAAAAVIGCACIACAGFARPVPDGPDFGAMVTANRERIEGKVVLFSGLRDGDFIFAVRERIPRPKAVVIRGSKLFYTCTAGPDLDLVPYVSSRGEIAEVMRRFAFESVFVERDNRVGTTQDDWLREYLSESGDYARVGSFVVESARNRCASDVLVDVYSLTRPWQRQVDYFDIPVPRTRRSIRVDLRSGTVREPRTSVRAEIPR
jgi:hypothetical protein